MKEEDLFGSEEERLSNLLHILRGNVDEAACQECLTRLDNYIAAQLAGQDYLKQFPKIAVHLDACLDCADAYARLYELELAVKSNRLLQSNDLPKPALFFLEQGEPKELNSEQANAKRLLTSLMNALQYTADAVTLFLSPDLLPLLRPLPAAATTRKPVDRERYHERLLQLNPADIPNLDIPFSLTAYRDTQHPTVCLVEVAVRLPGQSWPNLGGHPVALQVGDQEHTVTTDAWGIAAFPNILIGGLDTMKISCQITS